MRAQISIFVEKLYNLLKKKKEEKLNYLLGEQRLHDLCDRSLNADKTTGETRLH